MERTKEKKNRIVSPDGARTQAPSIWYARAREREREREFSLLGINVHKS